MRLREQELLTLPGRDERWENFMLYTQGTCLFKACLFARVPYSVMWVCAGVGK
jgi:hypothetical protein